MTFYMFPSRRFANLRQSMDRMLEESLAEANHNDREMQLAVDIQTSDEAYLLTAFVPGLSADDLNIEILNNTVTIQGEFKPTGKEDAKYLMSELPSGQFSRVITLPTSLDAAKTEASIKNGILMLNVPKAEVHRPKSIKVVSN